jgi:hypothetical protein
MSTTEPVGTSEISPVKSSDIVNSPNVTNNPSASAEEAVVNANAQEAVVNANAQDATMNANAQEPAMNATVPDPAMNVNAQEPVMNANAQEATINANAQEPTMNATAEEPVTANVEEATPPPEMSANVEPSPAEETPDVNATPATASPELNAAPALAPIAPVEEKSPYTLSSSQQAVLDSQEKELREVLVPRWNQEFADIPEKYRPKAKAYDARSIVSYRMKYPDDEAGIEEKIQGFIERDRRATQIRMGELPRVATAPLSAPIPSQVEANSEINPRNYLNSAAHVKNFSPPATIFRDQVRKTREHLHKILKNTQKKLQSKAVNKNTRKAAKSLVSAFRKETDYLLREAKRQADELERAAKQRIREERRQAYERIMEHARENLKIVTGSIPTKNMTRRLASARRKSAGRGVNAQAFVNSQSRMRKPRSYSANSANPVNYDPVFV